MMPDVQPPLDAKAPPDHRGLGVLVLGLAVGLLFVGLLLVSTNGHFVPPVVDLYVVCQYAKAMAEGHPFRYNAGEAGSTGATSLLHTAILALGHAAGARGEGLVALAVILGLAFFLVTIGLVRRIGSALGGPAAGTLAGALVALNGPVAWGFMYGSDIALFMLLGALLLERMLAFAETGRTAGLSTAGVLLALARPEGLAIGILLAGLLLREARTWRDRARAILPTAAAGAVLLVQRLMTGAWLGTSVADKSLYASYGLVDSLGLSAQYAVDVLRGLLLGFYSSEAALGFSRGFAPFYFPPLSLLLLVFCAARTQGPGRRAVRAWLAIVAVVWVLVIPNVFMGVHFNRYLMWAFPGLLALTAAGIQLLARSMAQGDVGFERRLFRSIATVALGLGALSAVRFAALYAEGAGVVWRRDVATATWISKALPAGVAMANIATSVEYLTGHRNLNLHGVTSPAFFGNQTAEREAGTFESLGRLPQAERPQYLISSVAAQEGSPVLRRLAPGPPLFQSTSLSDELQVLRLQYDLVDRNRQLFSPETFRVVSGLREIDRLNVCDNQDERAHAYRYSSSLGNVALHGTVRIDTYASEPGETPPPVVADAGRMILGQESFRVKASPGRDLVLVMRTAGSAEVAVWRAAGPGMFELEVPEAGILVTVGGQAAGRMGFRPEVGWNEAVFRVPARLLQEGTTHFLLQGRYTSYFYWFFQ
jgi:hypothetical protein